VHALAHVTVRDIGRALTRGDPGERQRGRDHPRPEASGECGIGRQRDGFEHRCIGKGRSEVQVHELRTPTLLIVGEHDVIAPPALMKMFQSSIPHARLAEVAGAGHAVYFEKPAEFHRLVLEFFTAVGV
jgi:pimeloyl-ACP methyl ester carboxylesterase